jgi:hypothetical protein
MHLGGFCQIADGQIAGDDFLVEVFDQGVDCRSMPEDIDGLLPFLVFTIEVANLFYLMEETAVEAFAQRQQPAGILIYPHGLPFIEIKSTPASGNGIRRVLLPVHGRPGGQSFESPGIHPAVPRVQGKKTILAQHRLRMEKMPPQAVESGPEILVLQVSIRVRP